MSNLLRTIVSILFVLWIIGFITKFTGSFIHLLLVLAVILFAYDVIMRNRSDI